MIQQEWCAVCRRRSEVIDKHDESYYDGGSGGAHEYGYMVYDLACGHEAIARSTVVGPAPGAPYAWRFVAATHHYRDLAEVRAEEIE